MPKKKPIGVVHDPWQQMHAPPEPEPSPEDTPVRKEVDLSSLQGDLRDKTYSTISLPGYGGITVEGTSEPKVAAAQILEFCVNNKDAIDDTLVYYGVLLAQVESPTHLRFFIQRHDEWTLCVPDAQTRESGCLQLIQAMLAIQSDTKLRPLLRKYHIRAYRV